jgi:hypothetical protein
MPCVFYHLSSFIPAQHNFWGAPEEKLFFVQVPDAIFLHRPVPSCQLPCPSHNSKREDVARFQKNQNGIDRN